MKLLPGPQYFENNVFMRNDTIFGGCQALGDDLGFNPDFLRIPLAAGIIVAPLLMVGIYLSVCALMFVSRTFFPDRTSALAPAAPAEAERHADNETVELPQAA